MASIYFVQTDIMMNTDVPLDDVLGYVGVGADGGYCSGREGELIHGDVMARRRNGR